MFILYAVVFGLVVGAMTGGHVAGLSDLRFRLSWLIVGGLAVQLALFSQPISGLVGDLGPWLYVGSTAAVVVAMAANRTIPGIPIVIAGALCNLVAIVANGGYMPAGPAAMAALGKTEAMTYSNSVVNAQPVLWPLTDIFALPRWLPFTNVFSVGDVLIGVGVVVVIVVAMRRPRPPIPAGRPPTEDLAVPGASGH